MNPLDLPFDIDEMLAGLKPWIQCESPTYDAAAGTLALPLPLTLACRSLTVGGFAH